MWKIVKNSLKKVNKWKISELVFFSKEKKNTSLPKKVERANDERFLMTSSLRHPSLIYFRCVVWMRSYNPNRVDQKRSLPNSIDFLRKRKSYKRKRNRCETNYVIVTNHYVIRCRLPKRKRERSKVNTLKVRKKYNTRNDDVIVSIFEHYLIVLFLMFFPFWGMTDLEMRNAEKLDELRVQLKQFRDRAAQQSAEKDAEIARLRQEIQVRKEEEKRTEEGREEWMRRKGRRGKRKEETNKLEAEEAAI